MIHNEKDTICAVSTPAGVGGIAVVRISGPQAIAIADTLWKGRRLADTESHRARFGAIMQPGEDEMLDEAVATVFRAPRSFTGEDVVELSVHGSKYVQRRLLELLVGAGCRLAEPGEFTRRAFANGKMDLAQAEAVADVIASNSRAAHRLAASQMKGTFSKRLNMLRDKLLELASLLELELDFSEEDVEFASRSRLRDTARQLHDELQRLCNSFSAGQAIKDGIPVAIIGPTNAGKSSLLNMLLGEDRAIVSDIHGTTRDTIEDTLEIGDYLFRFIDTAGFRPTTDPIETLGIDRSRQAADRAAIILSVSDASLPAPDTGLGAPDTSLGAAAVAPPASSLAASPVTTRPDVILSSDSDVCYSVERGTGELSSDATLGDASLVASDPSLGFQPDADTSSIGMDSAPTILLLNKIDLLPAGTTTKNAASICDTADKAAVPYATIPISTKTGEGHDRLRATLIELADRLRGNTDEDTLIVTNLRHAQALREAADYTAAIIDGLSTNLPGDLLAQDLRATIASLSSITGTLTTPDILASIFSRFCIGK